MAQLVYNCQYLLPYLPKKTSKYPLFIGFLAHSCYNEPMLELKNISRVYQSGENTLKALDRVSISFRQNEFVSILGPSGSGKTTLLNIIGGLDHYTDGDLKINGISTKDYTDRDWDAHRNRNIGFVFQNYNLIQHQTILENVELALTLSGISGSERRKRATKILTQVGLKDHLEKRPSQLSGGQMQRVAIARALVNDPKIILADEPTGALDSKTSLQIMELLKDIAKDKLVIMVTHNPDLAKKYSTRIVNIKDGSIEKDTNPFDDKQKSTNAPSEKHISLSFLSALKLSTKNLMTKRGRTTLTAIAGSIGIIGIALILALANGVNNNISRSFNQGSLVSPITVQETFLNNSASLDLSQKQEPANDTAPSNILVDDDLSLNFDIFEQRRVSHNDTKALKKYLEEHRSELNEFTETIFYDYGVVPQVYEKDASGDIIQINPIETSSETVSTTTSLTAPATVHKVSESKILKSAFSEIVNNDPYELLSGKLPTSADELLLVANSKGEIPLSTMYTLDLKERANLRDALNKLNSGQDVKFSSSTLEYSDIIGKTYRISLHGENYDSSYPLKIVGIAKAKNENDPSGYLGYTGALTEKIIQASPEKYSIDTPNTIYFYPKTELDKAKITAFLDQYNDSAANKITYADQSMALVETIKSVVNVISFVLIGFVAISLVVSSIMIGIITYISVLERTKEIGILRAIGASKRDVVRVFRAETVIEGLAAGIIGVIISYLLCAAISSLASAFGHIDGIADLSPVHALVLILISVLLTVFAGASPAYRASKKDPVEALRSE